MKATYDAETDTLSIIFRADARIAESDERKPEVILDYDEQGTSSAWRFSMPQSASPTRGRSNSK